MERRIWANLQDIQRKKEKSRYDPKIDGPHTVLIEFQSFWVTNQDGGEGRQRTVDLKIPVN